MRKIFEPHNVLKEIYGFDTFRPTQEGIIDAVLSGKDGLAVLTTGGGKSLCFQIPALSCEGTTLVISPLISLMKDQVDALNARGVKAGYINSSLTPEESIERMTTLRAGGYRLFYAAPERLVNEDFIDALKGIEIPFVAVDEAHCISTWGHDFRISYTKIAGIVDDIGNAHGKRIPRFAYTATATQEIRDDIVKQLGMEDPYIYVGKFDRPNIEFNVRESINKVQDIYDLIQQSGNKPTIIYSATIKAGQALVDELIGMNVNAGIYHGRLDSEVKNKVQEDFLNNKIQVMVATNAFGMGVDKPDVRNVIHYHMPGNIENYYQEAGRAGRDGENSNAYIFYNKRDRRLQEFFIDCTFPANELIKSVQYFIAGFGMNEPFNISHEQISQIAPDHIKPYQIDSILRVLEDQGVIKLHNFEVSDDHASIEILDANKDLELSYLSDRKRVVIDNLNAMERFCLTNLCRRRYLLRYFGERDAHKNCGSCDVCLTQKKEHERFKATIPEEAVKNVLGIVVSTDQKFEPGRLTDMLLGVNNASMKRRGFDQLEEFGSLKNWSKPDVEELFKKLEHEELLIAPARKRGALSITEKGAAVLSGEKRASIETQNASRSNRAGGAITSPVDRENEEKKVVTTNEVIDQALYAKLSKLRTHISQEIEKPIFMVFSDQMMKVIASRPPNNIEDLGKIGLTPGRVKLFGDKIIRLVSRHHELSKSDGNNFVI